MNTELLAQFDFYKLINNLQAQMFQRDRYNYLNKLYHYK